MDSRVYALVPEHDPRHEAWIRKIGSDFLPIVSRVPRPANLTGTGSNIPCYFVDFSRIDPEIVREIAGRLAFEKGESVEDALEQFRSIGFPLIADGLMTCTDPEACRTRAAKRCKTGGGSGGPGHRPGKPKP